MAVTKHRQLWSGKESKSWGYRLWSDRGNSGLRNQLTLLCEVTGSLFPRASCTSPSSSAGRIDAAVPAHIPVRQEDAMTPAYRRFLMSKTILRIIIQHCIEG